jgi:hypothetical protein
MNHCPLCKLPIVNGAKIRCTCKLSDRERRLPNWAQQELDHLRHRLDLELERRQTLEAAHSVLKSREWFVLPGPVERTREARCLYLYWNDKQLACSLDTGDVVLIGRAGMRLRDRSTKRKGYE